MTKAPSVGSSLDSFLEEEGIRDEVHGTAIKRVRAWTATAPSELGPDQTARITHVVINDIYLSVHLDDGRVLSTPLSWYPRLLTATPDQRNAWELIGGGHGVSWPDLDEDLSLDGMLRGQPAFRTLRQVEQE